LNGSIGVLLDKRWLRWTSVEFASERDGGAVDGRFGLRSPEWTGLIGIKEMFFSSDAFSFFSSDSLGAVNMPLRLGEAHFRSDCGGGRGSCFWSEYET
jgi:hypothetical protein